MLAKTEFNSTSFSSFASLRICVYRNSPQNLFYSVSICCRWWHCGTRFLCCFFKLHYVRKTALSFKSNPSLEHLFFSFSSGILLLPITIFEFASKNSSRLHLDFSSTWIQIRFTITTKWWAVLAHIHFLVPAFNFYEEFIVIRVVF